MKGEGRNTASLGPARTRLRLKARVAFDWSVERATLPDPAPPDAGLRSGESAAAGTASLDPLYTGELRGVVPENWSRDGWIMVTRDRMNRTDDPIVLARLRAELDAIEGRQNKH